MAQTNQEQRETSIQVTRLAVVKSALASPDFELALQQAMPQGQDFKRMIRGALTCMQLNDKLITCDLASLKMEMIKAAQFGFDLAPSMGEAYLVPFRDNRNNRTLCVLIPGYNGLMKLAIQSPHVQSIRPEIVKEGDAFDYDLGLNPYIKHKPAMSGRGKAVYFYCVVKMHGGDSVFQVWSKEDCLKHGALYSKTFHDKNGKWQDLKSQDQMCLKTVVRMTLKYVPKSASDPLALALTMKDKAQEAIDVPSIPIHESEAEYVESEDVDGHEPLPPNREYLKGNIAKLFKEIPPANRKDIVIPANLDECTDSELMGINAALLAVGA